MKKYLLLAIAIFSLANVNAKVKTTWPDGTVIDAWFDNKAKVDVNNLGKRYVITDYGVKNDSNLIQTSQIQAVINRAADNGGGVIVIPRGTYQSGSLFFKKGTNLLVDEGGKLKGSDRIENFKIVNTRFEGQNVKYFAALVNADKVDGFTIAGKGTIDGNGLNYWKEFWIRRQWNSECTNMDAQRPRLVYISNSSNVTVQDVHLVNSPVWTNHIYRCDHVRYLDCYIYAPTDGVKAPSSDAIDIDVCHDVLINGCYMNVNDDAVVLKGGKGIWADTLPENGDNTNIIIENCKYGRVHGCLTLGSESLHDRNIILRNCSATNANRVLWLKMRPDTPQHYEYVTVDGFTGNAGSFLVVRPWTQFFKPGNRKDMPKSLCNNISIKNVNVTTANFFDVAPSDKYDMTNFSYQNVIANGKAVSAKALDVMLTLRLCNGYFMKKYADPTTPTNVNKIRASNLWTRAVYYEGLMALYDVDKDKSYINYTDKWANFHKWSPRSGVNTMDADNQCCGQTYIDRYMQSGGEDKIKYVKENLDLQMKSKIGWWTWIDAIQMSMPVYAKMTQITKDRKYIDHAMKMYTWTRDTLAGGLFNTKEGLWWRDKDYVPPYKEKDGVNCYWSRGSGWVYAAILRTMETLKKDDPYYISLKKDFLLMTKAAVKCQRKDGLWNVSLLSKVTYPGKELTGSALFLYGLSWGINNGILDKSYKKYCDKAWNGIKECVHTDGMLGWVQGTGKDPSAGQPLSYDKIPDFEDYGTGCFLLGGTEYYKLIK